MSTLSKGLRTMSGLLRGAPDYQDERCQGTEERPERVPHASDLIVGQAGGAGPR
jgi:hypothetical protein